MAWVTLALRKKELKATHSYYVKRDLEIARAERQDARRYQYEQTVINNDQQEELSDLRSAYMSDRTGKREQINQLREQLSIFNSKNDDTSAAQAQDINNQISDLQQQISDAKETYEYDTNITKEFWEDELAMIENEANDVETAYEMEKVDIETQMESISNEIEAIDSQLSTEIKNNTIKLS